MSPPVWSVTARAGAGEKHTVIQYDPALYQWNMSVANNPAISGVSYSDVNSLVSSNPELWRTFTNN